MKFKKLSMHNWIPYKGVNEIKFSTDPNKHITFIRGRNKGGKTAIMRAIRWVLYGNTGDSTDFQTPESLLNAHARDEKDYFLKVALEVTKDNKEILITRSLKSKNLKNLELKETFNIQENGSSVTGNLDKYILEFLAEEISDFFIFDGEKLDNFQNLTKPSSKSGTTIKNQIERVIRTPFLRSAASDISSIKADLNKRLGNDTTDERLKSMYKERSEIDEYKNSFEGQRDELASERAKFEEQAGKLQSDIDAFEDSAEIISQRNTHEAKLNEQKKKLDIYKNAIAEQSDDYWKAILASIIKKDKKKFSAKKSQIEADVEQQVKNSMYQKSIDTNSCQFYEEPLTKENKQKIKNLIEKSSYDNANSMSDLLTLNRMRVFDGFDSKVKSFNDSMKGFETVQEEIIRSENKIYNLNQSLEGVDDQSLQAILKKKKGVDEEISKITNSLEDIDAVLNGPNEKNQQFSKDGILSQLASMDKVIEKIEKGLPQNTRNKKLKALTQSIEKALKDTVETLSLEMRKSVETLANDMDEQLAKEDHLNFEITDNFGLKVLDDFGNESTDSAAGFQMIALSFFYGLKESTGLKGPLIIDTPFARVDLINRDSILSALPKMSEQCVLIVHSGEIAPDSDLETLIANDIGSHYEIDKQSKHLSQLIKQ